MSAYVGIGPPIARLFGGKTKTVWEQGELIISDLFAVTKLTPHEAAEALRSYAELKRELNVHLSCDEACERIYSQKFYPLVTHFTFAFQSSAVARLRFVKRVAAATCLREARVADLGCGSGAMLCEVLQSQPDWMGYGLDISEVSVEYARKLAIHKGVANRATFHRGDCSCLPFADASLDLVIASEVIEHLPDPGIALEEISRVLVPGGFLALTVPLESHTPTHRTSLSDAEEFHALCARAGLSVQSLSSKWHVTFGDDRRHLFAVAQRKQKSPVTERVYSLPRPHMSSAASSGIVSS